MIDLVEINKPKDLGIPRVDIISWDLTSVK